jgi:hypothetical protein
MNKFCNQCGHKLHENNLFCTECGASASAEVSVSADTKKGEFSEPEVFTSEPPVKSEDTPAASPEEGKNVIEVTPEILAEAYVEINDKDKAVTSGSKLKRVLIAVASVLISLVLFMTVTAGQSWFILRNAVSNNNVSAMAKAVFDEINLAEFPIFNFVDVRDFELHDGVGLTGDEVLYEAIWNAIDEYYIEEFDVAKENIKELLDINREELQDFRYFLDGVIDGGVAFILGGSDTQIIAPLEVVQLLENNVGHIEYITGYTLVDTDLEDIQLILQNSRLDDLTWNSAFGNNIADNAFRSFMQFFNRNAMLTLVLTIIVFTGLVILLFVLNRKRASNALLYFGIPCIISGLGVMIVSFLAVLPFRWIAEQLDFSVASSNAMQNTFSAIAGNVILYCGLAVFSAGVIAVAAKVLVNTMTKKIF